MMPAGRHAHGVHHPKGSPSYRRNNPRNCRYSHVGYLTMYGTVINDNGFASFETSELGWPYLHNLIREKIAAHPDWTILRFFQDPKEGYSPASDGNDPVSYAKEVAGKLGENYQTFVIKNIL
jgi:hypothetical protein